MGGFVDCADSQKASDSTSVDPFPKEKNETQWGNQGMWLAQVTRLLSSQGRSKTEASGHKLGFTFPACLI